MLKNGTFRMGLYGSAPPRLTTPLQATFAAPPPNKILIVHLFKDRMAFRAPSLSSAEASSPPTDRAVLFCDIGVVFFFCVEGAKKLGSPEPLWKRVGRHTINAAQKYFVIGCKVSHKNIHQIKLEVVRR